MIRRYGKNRKMIEACNTMLSVMVFITVSSILVMLFFIIGFALESGAEWSDDEDISIFVFLAFVAVSAVLSILSSKRQKKQEYLHAMIYEWISMVLWLAFSIVLVSNGEDSDMDTLAIIYIILSLVIIPVFLIWELSEAKKKSIVCSNLEKCYIEMDNDKLKGVCLGSVEVPGNSTYFEIAYADIKSVRTDHNTDPNSGRYYNLFIDHAYGTFKLCIDSPRSAFDALKNIREKLEKGEDPFEEIKKEEAEKDRRNSIVGSDKPLPVEKNDVGLIRCPTCQRWQSNEHEKCFRCGQVFLIEGKIPLVEIQPEKKTEAEAICCPGCKKWQSSTNKWCFNCGTRISGND